jgi:hypothetical protein
MVAQCQPGKWMVGSSCHLTGCSPTELRAGAQTNAAAHSCVTLTKYLVG